MLPCSRENMSGSILRSASGAPCICMKQERKITLLGVMTGASRPRSSPSLHEATLNKRTRMVKAA